MLLSFRSGGKLGTPLTPASIHLFGGTVNYLFHAVKKAVCAGLLEKAIRYSYSANRATRQQKRPQSIRREGADNEIN